MNKLIFKANIASAFFCAFLVMTSCSSDSNEDPITEQQQISSTEVKNNLEALEVSKYVDDMVLDQSFGIQNPGRATNKMTNDCIEKDFSEENSYSITYTDCEIFGNTINGKITVSYIREENTISSSVTFEDFVYNDRSVNGTKTTSFTFDQENNTCSYTVTSDMTIQKGEDFTATIKGTRNIEVTYDENEHTRTTTGNWDTTINEDTYVVSIDTPLVDTSSCEYTVSGVLTVTENGISATIDYGDGECDNLATMTLADGTTEEIEL